MATLSFLTDIESASSNVVLVTSSITPGDGNLVLLRVNSAEGGDATVSGNCISSPYILSTSTGTLFRAWGTGVSGTVTFVWESNQTYRRAQIVQVLGATTTVDVIQLKPRNTILSTAINITLDRPPLGTNLEGGLFFIEDEVNSWTPGSGYTQIRDADIGTYRSFILYDATAPSDGLIDATKDAGSLTDWAGYAFEIGPVPRYKEKVSGPFNTSVQRQLR